jgi:hypothetical protein
VIRFSTRFRCPICDGCDSDERGAGKRCAGFVSDDPDWARCTRPEHAGDLKPDERTIPATYAHRLTGACRCGTEHGAALTALSAHMSHPAKVSKPRGRVVKTYPYRDASGVVVYRKVRTADPKDFFYEHQAPDGRWVSTMDGAAHQLYRLPELIAEPTRAAWIVEGEKDVETLVAAGLLATSTDALHTWRPEYAEHFRGRQLAVVLPDNDAVGLEHAHQIAASLHAVDCPVAVLELPGLPPKGDVTDFLQTHTVDVLKALAQSAPLWSPPGSPDLEVVTTVTTSPTPEKVSTVVDTSEPPRDAFPEPIDPAAFHGLAGDVVKAIDPHTEADPVAVLLGFLTAFGNAAGASAHFVVGSTDHPGRIFAAMVGETSRARKGDSWAAVRRLMVAADPQWAGSRIQGGLSSGEGLISAVRDPIEGTDTKTSEVKVIDAGITDKRLLVVEPELARTLRVMRRDGSTLSTIIRDAWDSGVLRVMTKTQLQATGAHVSIIGHITVDELRREMDETSLGNGFANRFLLLAVKRSKELPEPEPFAGEKVEHLAQRISRALAFARTTGTVDRGADAREDWLIAYSELTKDRPGMLGALLNRSEAHAVRLSLLYALLDRSATVRRVHLEAALAVLDYVDASTRFIFANRLGDPIADTLLATVHRRSRMTRTDVRDLFGRHESSARIDAAIGALEASGRITITEESSGGRPVTVLTARTSR